MLTVDELELIYFALLSACPEKARGLFEVFVDTLFCENF